MCCGTGASGKNGKWSSGPGFAALRRGKLWLEVAFCEGPSGVGFEILLEGSGFCMIPEGSGNFDLPGSVRLCAWRLSAVVFTKARFQMPCQADVVAISFGDASKDVDVVETHGLLRRSMPVLPCEL